jgi:hypothetical protein
MTSPAISPATARGTVRFFIHVGIFSAGSTQRIAVNLFTAEQSICGISTLSVPQASNFD